jgi:hypothetical protein
MSYAGEGKQVAVLLVKWDILEIDIHQLCHVFGARMDVGVGIGNVADAESATGFRHQLHQANRTDAAAGALVETRFLIALRHQQKGVESVLAGVLPEDLDRVTKTLHVSALGRGVQLLELSQVGPGLIRPVVHVPGDLGDRGIERCEQFRVVRADRPADLGSFSQGRLRVRATAEPNTRRSRLIATASNAGYRTSNS